MKDKFKPGDLYVRMSYRLSREDKKTCKNREYYLIEHNFNWVDCTSDYFGHQRCRGPGVAYMVAKWDHDGSLEVITPCKRPASCACYMGTVEPITHIDKDGRDMRSYQTVLLKGHFTPWQIMLSTSM